MSAIQLSFSLRLSSGVKTVHLLGSWDNYAGQLPLSKDKSSSRSGSWKGTFRFGSTTLEAGQRYWYYYIIDGYHVSHNPSESSIVEPITGRALNILDVPRSSKSSTTSKSSTSNPSSSKSSRSFKISSRHSRDSHSPPPSSHKSKRGSLSVDIPMGRPLSISQIRAPKPLSPHATKHILQGDFDEHDLSSRFAATGLHEYSYDFDDVITDFGGADSPASSVGSFRSDSSRSGSSLSGYSTPASECSSCTCERYGITRKGERIRIDCGGSRCRFDDECSSSDDDYVPYRTSSRRHAVVVR